MDHFTAMRRALDLAARGPKWGPNPRVGCVLLAGPPTKGTRGAAPGTLIGEGWHKGAGTPHAEVAAIADAKARDKSTLGATAVVTLEPCAHTGRTGPCTDALIEAGVADVVYALPDPGLKSRGGAEYLQAHGVKAEQIPTPSLQTAAKDLVQTWYHSVTTGRPWIILKTATSLDGRVAAPDGTSQWITGPEARAHAHQIRGAVDAIIATTGTVWHDDPALTARTPSGELARHQPLRIVVGHRDLPREAKLYGPGGELLTVHSHDVSDLLNVLGAYEVRTALVEGGPALSTALLRADVVDELHAYLAPLLLGAGPTAVSDFGIATLGQAPRWHRREIIELGPDVLIVARRNSGG